MMKKTDKTEKKEILINNKYFTLILVLILLVLSGSILVKTFQNDTFYSIKIGKLILNNGIDMMDHFSFHNIAYTYPHWLYDVFIYLIYKLDGLTGIYISTIILNMTLITTIFLCTKKLTKSFAAPFTVSLITLIIMGSGYATARAQLVTYILFVLEIFFIESYINNKNKKYLLGLLLISLLICNIHVAVWPFYFILYLPYIAESIISKILKKIKKENKLTKLLNKKFDIENDIPLKELLIIMFLSSLTGLLTPIKNTPYVYLYKTMIGNSEKYILEHRSSNFKDAIFTLVILLETMILGGVSKMKMRDLFLLLGLGIMSLASIRHTGLLAVLLFLSVARTYYYFIKMLNFDIDKAFYKLFINKISLIIIMIIVGLISFLGIKRQLSQDFVDDKFYPIEATKFIKENLDTTNMRLYNEYNIGSYLLYNDIKVFIDSRADLYTKQFSGLDYDIFDDYAHVNDDYKKTLDFYKITHALIYKNTKLYNSLKMDGHYKLLYEDLLFALFEKQNLENN